jgi:hypothetical protein
MSEFIIWNPWLWIFAPYRCGVEMMDALLYGFKFPEVAFEPPKGTPQEAIGEIAMKRLKSGYASPREIYDIRNRGQINWSDVPAWAWPVDPELFEAGHEG